jgi:hypothetical protein
MDPGSGTFTAPFSGVYGFFFYAEFYCFLESNLLYVYHDGNKIKIFECQFSEGEAFTSQAVYFALNLAQGNTVRIYSGTVRVYSLGTFMGFLMQKH